jgi:hypothetical protein
MRGYYAAIECVVIIIGVYDKYFGAAISSMVLACSYIHRKAT